MNKTRLIILLLAVFAAGAAAIFLMSSQRQARAQQAQKVATETAAPAIALSKVLVTNKDVPIGATLKADDLAFVDWPTAQVNKEIMITQDADAKAIETFTGATARQDAASGEPVTIRKFVKPGDQSFMAAILRPGMVATSVKVDPETAAGGFILPGDRVNVLASRSVPIRRGAETGEEMRAGTIFEDVRVLAIETTYQKPEVEKAGAAVPGKYITLEMTPRDAEAIMLADRMSELQVVLRSLSNEVLPDADPILSARRGGNNVLEQGGQFGAAAAAAQAGENVKVPTVRVHSNGAVTDTPVRAQ
jgi:pilus assembly protein CpaB